MIVTMSHGSQCPLLFWCLTTRRSQEGPQHIRGSNMQWVLVTMIWDLKGKLSSFLSIMFDTNVQNLLALSYADPDLAVIAHLSGTDLELLSLTHTPVVWKLSKSINTPPTENTHPSPTPPLCSESFLVLLQGVPPFPLCLQEAGANFFPFSFSTPRIQ